jgi:uncharacterized protein
MKRQFKILSLDGGGFAGVTTAKILQELNVRSCDFDLVAGTSTGAILGAGIRAGKSPQEILALYRERGSEIFPPYWKRVTGLRLTGGLLRPRYSSEPLKRILAEVFGDTAFGELPGKTIVNTYDISSKEFLCLRNWKTPYASRIVKDLVLSSASAPVYFPPNGTEVDGGIVVNNPTMVAVAAAIHLGVPLTNIFVLSVGTGFKKIPVEGISAKLGAVTWGVKFPSITLQGTSQVVDYQAREILPDGNYVRLNVPLNRAEDALDNASPTQYRDLIWDTEDYLRPLHLEEIRTAFGLVAN